MLAQYALALAWLALSVSAGPRAALSAQDLTRKGAAPALPLGLFRHLHRAQLDADHAQNARHAADKDRVVGSKGQQWQIALGGAPDPREDYGPNYFRQRVSHVEPHRSEATFRQRYWFDASFYQPGGPIFLLDGGETDGAGRIPFLESGILHILAEATGGMGVVLEHRYYGDSMPVDRLDTDSLRFLTTEQSLHDSAYFAQNVVFPGFRGQDLSPRKVPWIYYGGSYAGAKSAFARKLFPDLFWGAIASSAVTTAVLDFHDYYTPIMEHGPLGCIEHLTNHTALIDSILALNSSLLTPRLKGAFGLGGITSDADFVNALAIPLGSWQARNWDPAVGSSRFFEFCDALVVQGESPAVSSRASDWTHRLPADPRKEFESLAGYAAYVREHVAALCPPDLTQDECFGTDEYGGDDLEEAPWKSWSYQFCTEWGYFIGHGPEADEPSIVSRLLDIEYTSKICRIAFPEGEVNRVPSEPNITAVNQYGNYGLSYPRLAFVDGSEDPWLYATPHSPLAPHHGHRPDTLREPFKLIPGGVHHWDQNGSADLERASEPEAIRRVHEEEVEFVRRWVEEWKEGRGRWKWRGDGGRMRVGRWEA
ncbi:hypothetical protein JCM8202v2_004571 [Rhodotorula sphaerocarpa]